ncbi:hypothetical protein DNTS_020892 [Danionella cerebrum]|uniref:EF-hand domain-containing protein n=1 Tax=Danionella cerebrum TaxID=2873325 RepID=A0A553RGL4_9TELE|nr:hypothetical protein DNTS_020892 [Danionella translucida]
MPTDLERAMETLIVVFHRYAGSEGNQVTLSRGELKQLMETELASYLRKTPDSISQIMSGLDTNGDGEKTTMPSDLERAMETLITVFHRYADADGKKGSLSRRELKTLMEKELASFLKSQKDPATVDKIMKDLDTNGDGEVNFEEFVSLVAGLSIACEQIYSLKSAANK